MIFKPIYQPTGRANEYGGLACNIYTGCNHGCTYCYAPSILKKSKAEFAQVAPRNMIVESVKKQLDRERITGQLIHLCFTCDPYPADTDTTPTREIIKAIKEAGNHVQILTKGGKRAKRDFDLLDSNDWFGITFSGLIRTDDVERWEPNAAGYGDRLFSLMEASRAGISTWVSCEPVIKPENIYDLIKAGSYIDLFRIGKMNYRATGIDWAQFGAKCEALCIERGHNYYIKDGLREAMQKAGVTHV